MQFENSLLPDQVEQAFAEAPDQPVWAWADDGGFWLEGKDAAEPGPYRSAKTPWTRRLQELWQRPVMHVWDWGANAYVEVPLKEIADMKSSQSGFTQGILNAICHDSKYNPRNCIYTADTDKTARDIADRLEPMLRKVDEDGDIFTGDDDDVGALVVRLIAMSIWFQGSNAMGKFASKPAERTVSDESEEQGVDRTDTSTDTALKSRKKTANTGLHVSLCKPKKKNGPIHKAYLRGNQEEFMVACPHCQYRQPLTFFRNEDAQEPKMTPFSDELIEIKDEQTGKVVAALPIPLPQGESRKLITGRLVFDHCKDKLGKWDKLRILRETYYECGKCQGKIEEAEHKANLVAAAIWIATAFGDPGVISQHINDLYSGDDNSSWGQIVLEFLRAKREGRRELQGFYNHVLGLPWMDEVSKPALADIRSNIAGRGTIYRIDAPNDDGRLTRQIFEHEDAALAAKTALKTRGYECDIITSSCAPYRRGIVPDGARGIILGGDVGGNYARWAVGAVLANGEDVGIFDWGLEIDPEAIAEIMISKRWSDASGGRVFVLGAGFCDAKFRKTDVLKACLAVPGRRLKPVSGLGAAAAKSVSNRLFSDVAVQGFPGMTRLDINDREAKDEYYITRLKKKRRRVFFPEDVEDDEDFVNENIAEELLEDTNGQTYWNPFPPPNHAGDCVKYIVIGSRWLSRRVAVRPPAKPAA